MPVKKVYASCEDISLCEGLSQNHIPVGVSVCAWEYGGVKDEYSICALKHMSTYKGGPCKRVDS